MLQKVTEHDMSLYYFMLQKVTGIGLFDRNTLYPVQSYCSSYTRLLISFTVLIIVHRVYVTVDYHTVLLLSLYRSDILSNMIQIALTELNNNENRQLTLGLGKLMEKTASVCWVDLGYRLRSRLTVPLQDFRG